MARKSIPEYNLIKQISTYGPGETWKAHSERADQFVIIHVLSLNGQINKNDQQKFFREAGICARLNHPGLVRFLAQGVAGNKFWFATELVQGISLSTFVEKRQPASVYIAVSIIEQVMDAVSYIHKKGIVHRGLRPESLLIEERDGGVNVYLTDLGSAKCFQSAELESTVTKLGERGFLIHAYTALEALENPQKMDPRSDIYALGAILYFLLSGNHPYNATDETLLTVQIIEEKPVPLHNRRPNLPQSLIKVVERAMNRDIASRYNSIEEMRQALQQVVGKSAPTSNLMTAPGNIIHVHGNLIEGDQTIVGNISGSTGVAIGSGVEGYVDQSHNTLTIHQTFEVIYKELETLPNRVESLSPGSIKDAQAQVRELENEAQKGEQANKRVLARYFRNLAKMGPDILDVVSATLINPGAGVTLVIRKIAQKARENDGLSQ